MAEASKAININYRDTVYCFYWCLNIWDRQEKMDNQKLLYLALLKFQCCCSHPLKLYKTCCIHNIAQPICVQREVLSPATLLWRVGTVRNQSLYWNNSCFYLCNGCRMTVHILAHWSCHKSSILVHSRRPCCWVVFRTSVAKQRQDTSKSVISHLRNHIKYFTIIFSPFVSTWLFKSNYEKKETHIMSIKH